MLQTMDWSILCIERNPPFIPSDMNLRTFLATVTILSPFTFLSGAEKSLEWAIRTSGTDEARAIASESEAIFKGPIGALDGFFLIDFSTSGKTGQHIQEWLDSHENVLWSEQQIPTTMPMPTGFQGTPMNNPLFGEAWHLQNRGQRKGSAGEDINVIPAWDAGVSGRGFMVAVVDTGSQMDHPDLGSNTRFDLAGNYLFSGSSTDLDIDETHGTSVSGIIAAADNAIGSVGVAYGAHLVPVRFIGGSLRSDATYASVLNHELRSVDIYNNSWGPALATGNSVALMGPSTLGKAAIEKGATEDTIIEGSPITEGRYRPTNFGNKYYGEVRMIDALTLSLNTVAIKLAKAVGIDSVINVARRMGITADLEPNLSLALRSSEVPMIEMAGAYATISSGGYAIKPFGITKISEKETGTLLFEQKPESSPRVFRGRDIQTLVNMMISVVQNGTGQGAKSSFFAAGKTGTTQDHRDAWFDGFSQDFIAVVWFGNDDNSPMKKITGGSLPARAWREIITAAKSDPSPSKYKLIKDSSGSSDFADLLNNLMSTPFPDLIGENNNGEIRKKNTFHTAPTFKPDRPGDNVGYGRFND